MEKVNEIIEDIIEGLSQQTKSGDVKWEDFGSIYQNDETIKRKLHIDDGNIYLTMSLNSDNTIKIVELLLDFPQIIENKWFSSNNFPSIRDIGEELIKVEKIEIFNEAKEKEKLSKLRSLVGRREARNRKIEKITELSKEESRLKKLISKLNPFKKSK